MRLIGILSWYDEPPTWLATAVAGAARFCDMLVAVDGAYALYPQGRPRSHPTQAEAIIHTAEALDLGVLLYQPPSVWHGNEVEKRQACLGLAGSLAHEGDWLFIFDADYHVLHCDAGALRAELESTDRHVASYLLLEGQEWDAAQAATSRMPSEWQIRTRDVFRWNPTLRVWPAHYCYTAVIDGKRRGLKGTAQLEPCLDLSSVTFYHRTADRSLARNEAQRRYYQIRDELKIELPEGAMEVRPA